MRCFYFQEYFVYFQFVFLLALTNMCAYNNMRNRVLDWLCIFLVCLHVCQSTYMCKTVDLRGISRNFPRRIPPTDNCIFFLRTKKKIDNCNFGKFLIPG